MGRLWNKWLVGMVAGIRGSCPDGSRLVSSDDVGHPLFDGGKS